ncbi:F-box family protein [Rhynchospora pubera]|uniref:F-box family protein n=1 Tax=Rhynchospora pubera TaxID=906938 RepID=A0AAV8BVV4_9POAL|nr:F-box family protein [Rhynchospora pubera]
MGPDWSLLPPELLEIIAGKVTSLADYIRFRAVCHPWRFASSPLPRHLPVQLPWLMLPYKLDGYDDYNRLFYDLSSSKIYRLHLPEIRGAKVCGSSHGWLILHKGMVTSLFNPITRATISLPPYTAVPSHLGISYCWDNDSAVGPTVNFYVKKAILTSSPLDTSCLVFVHTSTFWEFAFCKIGDERWTVIEFDAPWPWKEDFCDFSYCNGYLYAIHPYGKVTMYNLINPSKMFLDCELHKDHVCLVDGVDRDAFLISYGRLNYDDDDDGVVQSEIEYTVYQFSNDGEPQWIEVTDVGQNVLFLGGNRHALSLSSANLQLPDWGANSLCYDSIKTEQWDQQHNYCSSSCNLYLKLGRLDNGTVVDLTGDLGSFQRNRHRENLWLTPSLF